MATVSFTRSTWLVRLRRIDRLKELGAIDFAGASEKGAQIFNDSLIETVKRYSASIQEFIDHNITDEQVEHWLTPVPEGEEAEPIPPSWLDFALSLVLAGLRRHPDAENFNTTSIGADGKRWELTVQRADGVTPSERIRMLEEEVASLNEELEALRAQVGKIDCVQP